MKTNIVEQGTRNTLICGILWILFNNFVISIQSATIKKLAVSIHTSQIIFIYKFIVSKIYI